METALSGAGWEATGSESVAARESIDKDFAGLSSSALMVVVHSDDKTVADQAFQHTIASAQRVLKSDRRVKSVVVPRPGTSISRNGHTAIIQAGAGADAITMVFLYALPLMLVGWLVTWLLREKPLRNESGSVRRSADGQPADEMAEGPVVPVVPADGTVGTPDPALVLD